MFFYKYIFFIGSLSSPPPPPPREKMASSYFSYDDGNDGGDERSIYGDGSGNEDGDGDDDESGDTTTTKKKKRRTASENKRVKAPKPAKLKKKRRRIANRFDIRPVQMTPTADRSDETHESLSDDEAEYRSYLVHLRSPSPPRPAEGKGMVSDNNINGNSNSESPLQSQQPPAVVNNDCDWYTEVRATNGEVEQKEVESADDDAAQLDAIARHNAQLLLGGSGGGGGDNNSDNGNNNNNNARLGIGADDDDDEDGNQFAAIPIPGSEDELYKGLSAEHMKREEEASLSRDSDWCFMCWCDRPKKLDDSAAPTAYDRLEAMISRDRSSTKRAALCHTIQNHYETRLKKRMPETGKKYWSLKSIWSHLDEHDQRSESLLENTIRDTSILIRIFKKNGMYLENRNTGRKSLHLPAVREFRGLCKERLAYVKELKALREQKH